MKRLLILFLLVLAFVTPVAAQGEVPYVIDSTKPISADLKASLDAWLAVSPPSDAPYYVVTYTRLMDGNTLVSMAGLDLASPDTEWSLFEEGTPIVWLGTVTVAPDGSVTYDAPVAHAKVLARPLFAGGGAYLYFPFASGMSAQFGPRGVHGAGDYGTSGLLAVDLVSGDDMGATAAGPEVYASDAGTVDFVCDDGVSVAVRTHNTGTGDYFVYAHMLDNANLEVGHEFSQNDMMGTLKYGTFDDDCGWAEQSSRHYHLHWMFQPSGGKFQVGGCILTVSSQVWDCGGQTIRIGGFLSGGGGSSGDNDGGSTTGDGTAVRDPTFWDYFLTGILSVVDGGIIKLLPEHRPFEYTYLVFNMVSLTLRLVWVFAASNVSLVWLWRVILVGFGIKAIFGIIWFVAFLFKTWKSLVPVLGA